MKYKAIKKLYYSISEISDILDIKASVIRYWETEFKDLNPQRNRAGNRLYKEDDIDTIRLIQHYVHEKALSIHDANDLIQDLKKEDLYDRKAKELRDAQAKEISEKDSEPDQKNLTKDEETDKAIDEMKDNIPSDEGFEIVSTNHKSINEAQNFDQDRVDKETEAEKTKQQATLEFVIVPPTKETFIYPLDDQDDEPDDISEAQNMTISLDISPAPESEFKLASEPEPEPESKFVAKPQPESKPQPQAEATLKTVGESDTEIKELLRKISQNINDIIGILNE